MYDYEHRYEYDTEATTSTWKESRDEMGEGFDSADLLESTYLVVRDCILWRAVGGETTGMVVA